MAPKLSKGLWHLLILSGVLLCCIRAQPQPQPQPESQVPCLFLFGDSLVDNGNNNALPTKFRSDYLPYGIDFNRGPTGRFSNNETQPDVITLLLGFSNFIPPFVRARGREILRGVNYGSGAAGIRDDSGQTESPAYSLSEQIKNFESTVVQIKRLMGGQNATTTQYLNKCLYYIEIGNNDYIENYFLPNSPTSREYTPAQFARLLVKQLADKIEILRSYGAENFVLFGLAPIGCAPAALAKSKDGKTCIPRYNSAVRLFNEKLKDLVRELNRGNSHPKSIYINSYGIVNDMITKPSRYGFKVTDKACCRVGKNGNLCEASETACENRLEYVFFDALHPTMSANRVWGRRAYDAEVSSDTYPIDIRRLVLKRA